MDFVGGVGNIAITTALTPSFVYCIVNIKLFIDFLCLFLCLSEALVSGCED